MSRESDRSRHRIPALSGSALMGHNASQGSRGGFRKGLPLAVTRQNSSLYLLSARRGPRASVAPSHLAPRPSFGPRAPSHGMDGEARLADTASPQSECPRTAPSRLHGEPSKPAPTPPTAGGPHEEGGWKLCPQRPRLLTSEQSAARMVATGTRPGGLRAGAAAVHVTPTPLPWGLPVPLANRSPMALAWGPGWRGPGSGEPRQEPAGALQQMSRGTTKTVRRPPEDRHTAPQDDRETREHSNYKPL